MPLSTEEIARASEDTWRRAVWRVLVGEKVMVVLTLAGVATNTVLLFIILGVAFGWWH
jgi:hypothetical protein